MLADIVNATGGILKALKCSLFLLTYKWRNGRASLKTSGQLPSSNRNIVIQSRLRDQNEDLSSLTISELRERLREERLKVSRGKQELIDRLKDYYESIPEGCEHSVPAHVTVKQPDGTRQPVRTHDLEDAVKIKMLGFYYSLDAKKSKHVKEMVKKGVD